MNSWKQEILQNLVQRDERQQQHTSFYKSFKYLLSQVSTLETELETLKQDDTKSELAKALKHIQQLNEKLETQETLLYSEKKANHKSESKASKLQRNLNLLTDGYKSLQEKYIRLQEETKMKNQNIQVVNDDLLSLQIENNLLNTKVEKLTKERDQLIDRWMKKVSREADVLNDANKVLEMSKKSPSAD